ncbi:SDR family NAD(P)-dependent oxidoreductase [Kribbella sp. CA-293567]|uniref:SDR family NAD(P)-dependent oxidoreductase n=1 Tax=Kribbella sp. CA-293567 TaxID=3002436 RepID=UPI0022DCEB2B|nr:SDR family oxidoreductase [Kribbella sp. CA-293567]WBQ08475.1 SDR family NAD(P)-dependent oxidoreductase [Kribbella sp. CA-293567]
MTTALITGASSGIGRSAAIELARRGSGVILTYDKNKDGADETIVQIEKLGGKAVALPLSVGDSSTFPGFRSSVADALRANWEAESLDFLVNNAGFGGGAAFQDTTEEFFDELMRVLLKGPYFLTQTLLPLIADGGAIVNTTSHSALDVGVEAGFSAYATMKGGVLVLTRYLAKELAPRGIRVNSVAPGPTRTRLGGDAFAKYPELIEPLASRTALGRIGEPDDIGRMIAVLLSGDSAWVTGQNLEVSGGFKL